MSEAEAISEIFRRTEVDARNFPGIYVVGSFARPSALFSKQPRVTLVSQQKRALNLVYALTVSDRLKPGERVCVIGGGVAGLTAAVAAAKRQAIVTLLESKPHLLPLIHNTSRRWLHPYLYEWPEEESERLEADLPLINWRAAKADQVFKQIAEAFWRCHASGGIHPYVNVLGLKLQRVEDEWEVRWNLGPDRFKVVIVTVGLGAETPWPGVDYLSYWDNDNLDREDTRQSVPHTHHFISGCGDGGLIDFIRVRLRQFDHEGTFLKFLNLAPSSALRDQLREIETRARGDGGALSAEYNRMRGPEIDKIDTWIKSRLRTSTSATLHGQNPYAHTTKAASLNRFLVSRILRADASISSTYQPGELLQPIERKDGRYLVALRDESGQRVEAPFDGVTIRHGVKPALAKLNQAFCNGVDFHAACQLLPAGGEPDPTRSLLFDPAFFGGIAPISREVPRLPDPDASEFQPEGTHAVVRAQVPLFTRPSTPLIHGTAAMSPGTSPPPTHGVVAAGVADVHAPTSDSVPSSGGRYNHAHHVSRPSEERRARNLFRNPGRPVLLYGPDQRGKSWMFEYLVSLMRRQARTKVVRLLPGELNTQDLDGFLHDLALRIADQLGITEDIVTDQWEGAGSSRLKFGGALRSIINNPVLNDVDALVPSPTDFDHLN